MDGVKNRWKNWNARKTRSQNDGSSVVGVASPTPPATGSAKVSSSDLVDSPPPSDPSGKRAGVDLANPENRQPTTTSPSKATLDVSSNTAVHTHVPHSASLVVDPAEADPGPEEHLTKQSAELSISQRLWNAAYDSLEQDKDTADLVKSYLKTLTAVLNAEKPSAGSAPQDDKLEVESPTTRQEYLKELVSQGLTKIETSSKIKMAVGDVAQFILSAKGMIDLAIQNIPQAALPWAGVCIGLQVSSHVLSVFFGPTNIYADPSDPAQATKSNLAGITHVTSRMDWYCALTEHLLNKNNIMTGTESFQEVIEQLEKAVVLLYKELLLYQMKSVCSYYRHRGVGFLRGLANLDDWDGDLVRVKDAEFVVQEYSEQHYREYHKSSLRQLVDSGCEMEKHLGDIHQNLRDFIALQKTTRRNDEDKECLQDLFAVDPQYDLKDIEEKKDKLLDEAYDWILRTDEYATFINWVEGGRARPPGRVLWINGPAGTGKTMLFMGVIRKLSGQPSALSPSLSYFFCQGTDQTRNSATIILRSLIWQLLVQQLCLISHLRDPRRNAGAPLLRGERAFYVLSDALQSMLKDPRLSPVYFAIDALDECDRKTPGLDQLLQLIDTSLALSSKVKWLLSSRPEVLVHAGGKHLKDLHASSASVTLDPVRLEGPVNAYIDHKLDSMRGKDGYDTDTLAMLSDEIRQRAMSTFLWVALAFKELDGVDGWDAVETIQRIPSGLSNVYDLIMTQIEKGSPDNQKRCKNILVAVVLAYRTLSLPELAVLAGLQPKINPRTIVEKCGSFLTMSGKTVSLIHQSAKEYLEANYTTKLGNGVGHGHADISARSIDAMGSRLKHNIYALPYPGFKSSDITPPDPDPLAPIRYSCIFWIGHLCKAKYQGIENELTDGVAIFRFLKEHFLHWLEALSIIGGILENIRLLKELQAAVDSANNTELSAFLRDMHRFILFFRQVIDVAPLQTYYSGLVFAPQRSLIRQTFEKFTHNWISHVLAAQFDWSPCLYALEAQKTIALSVGFSATGDRLASGLLNGTVRIWDTTTGDCTQILQGHDQPVNSVAFLGKEDRLASVSSDYTLKIWDTATGDCVQTFHDHNYAARSVSFSAITEQLALGSSDGTIRVWDIAASEHVHTLDGKCPTVCSVAFSNTSERLAAGLEHGHTMTWDTITDNNMHEVDFDSSSVRLLEFSANGKQLASCHFDNNIRLWDMDTGDCMQILHGHNESVHSITFARNGNQLASASDDNTIKIWDIATGKCIQTLEGLRPFYSVSFSPTGDRLAASWVGGAMKAISIWDMAIGKSMQTLKGHIAPVGSLSFSSTGDQLASAGYDIRVWDMAIGDYMTTLQSHNYGVDSVAFSASARRLASGSPDSTIRIWDTVTGKCMQTLNADDSVDFLTFSRKGDILASALHNYTIAIWDTDKAKCTQILIGHTEQVSSLAFSNANDQLASGSWDSTIRIWDTVTGKCVQTLQEQGSGNPVKSVAFSTTGEQLASGSLDGVLAIWNTASGDCIWRLQSQDVLLHSVALSASGDHLASSSGNNIKIWNIATAHCIKDMTKEQSGLDQESTETQDEEDDEGNNDGLEEELSEEEESAGEEWGEKNTPAIAPVSAPIVHYQETEVYGYGLSPNHTWIAHDGQNILWLPPEFRPQCWAVQGHMVAIGCSSGRVLIFGFPPDGYSDSDGR
ncbi:hypothetical protein CNMCM5793_005530 [Aspergillus hiratsukae]|uniref:Mitochondrial division protein 1 n=1 Tax=Aspergillus hiratsukae TaxID=1194566 RepID=A0A8H6P513_9EURO|nr:hypothetical protein CNMCM5793_005530 [Aspergillus hiratsukae]KAF7170811.1 hypothetical protein CNMCM6106_005387 [Aspergillus hiratsukae]